MERKLEEKVMFSRQRAINLLEETPSFRQSTMRIFVTHECHDNDNDNDGNDTKDGNGNDTKDGNGTKDDNDNNIEMGDEPVKQEKIDESTNSCTITGTTTASSTNMTNTPTDNTTTVTSTSTTNNQTLSQGTNIIHEIKAQAPTQTQAQAPKEETTQKIKWHLNIEGRLLISHLDHEAALLMDQSCTKKAEQEHRKYVTQAHAQAPSDVNLSDMSSRERIATRFIYDREGEDFIIPYKFTHFWDKLSVSFQPFARVKQLGVGPNEKEDDSSSTRPMEDNDTTNTIAATTATATGKKRKRSSTSTTLKSKKKTSSSSSTSTPSLKLQQTSKPIFKPSGPITNLVWNRQSNNNQDAHAFHAIYEQPQQQQSPQDDDDADPTAEPTEREYMVVATIRLHTRVAAPGSSSAQQQPQRYKLSKNLISTLFPNLIPNYGSGSKQSKHGALNHDNGNTSTTSLSKLTVTASSSADVAATSSKNEMSSSSSNVGRGKNVNLHHSTITGTNDSVQPPPSSSTTTTTLLTTPITPPIDNDINIPKLLTMDDILHTIYHYIQTHKLLQPTTQEEDNTTSNISSSSSNINKEEKMMIHNDTKLQSLFQCDTMSFFEIEKLLMSRGLVIPSILGTPGDVPIVLTYIMKKDGAMVKNEDLMYEHEVEAEVDVDVDVKVDGDVKVDVDKAEKETKEKENQQEEGKSMESKDKNMEETNTNSKEEHEESKKFTTNPQQSSTNTTVETENPTNNKHVKTTTDNHTKDEDEALVTKRRRIEKQEQKTTKQPQTMKSSSSGTKTEDRHIPNLLSCDVDVDVPHLFHSRTRDILRRIKIREYEYTSCRNKALRTAQLTRASENDIKMLLEDIIRGRALTRNHLPVSLALAKASPKDSEARIGSHLDVRMAYCMDRLQYHCQNVKACWDVVDACRATL